MLTLVLLLWLPHIIRNDLELKPPVRSEQEVHLVWLYLNRSLGRKQNRRKFADTFDIHKIRILISLWSQFHMSRVTHIHIVWSHTCTMQLCLIFCKLESWCKRWVNGFIFVRNIYHVNMFIPIVLHQCKYLFITSCFICAVIELIYSTMCWWISTSLCTRMPWQNKVMYC